MIKEIISDTLKNSDNKFSSKKLMVFTAFNTAILIIWIAFFFPDRFKYPLDILLMLFTISGFTSVVSTVSTGVNSFKFNDIEKKDIENAKE